MSPFHSALSTASYLRNIPSRDLLRTYFVLKAASSSSSSKVGTALLTHYSKVPLLSQLLTPFIRHTVFQQFCGGETLEDSLNVARKLKSKGISSILDYAVEGEESDEGFKRTVRIVKDSLDGIGSDGFACVKMSAIGRRKLLDNVTSVMRSNGITGLEKGCVKNVIRILEKEEGEEFERVMERLEDTAKRAKKVGSGLVIDAEQYSTCSAVDMLAMQMQRQFNSRKKSVKKGCTIYMTMQMYLRDAETRWEQAYSRARKECFVLGVKAVRGAYLEQERREAQKKGVASPVWVSVEQTHAAFDQATCSNMKHVAGDGQALIIATHNEGSIEKVTGAANQCKIGKNTTQLYIGQLYGMRDDLTNLVKEAGYNAVKYVPFGPVERTLPYLVRRLEENRDLLSSVRKEVDVIGAELRRRGVGLPNAKAVPS